MDPLIHTLNNTRTRSALLVTVVLATSAQMQDNSTAQQLATVLFEHAEHILVTILSRNAKSPEIVLVGTLL
jgi:hypothetical protein